MKYKVFVDGQEGTTGLEIHERLKKRNDVEILKISSEKRKDKDERRTYINQADIVFLCLPDDAARESVSLLNVDNKTTRIIDASTAHRTSDDWAYGIPELSEEHRQDIQSAKKVSNPGCFATGFNIIVYPLVKKSIMPANYPVTCHAVTGYSGGGKKLIETFECDDNKSKLNSPCFYALGLQHKHLPEMQKRSGLDNPPIFTPVVSNYYRGMTVAVPISSDLLNVKSSSNDVHSFFSEYYKGQNFVKVMPFGIQNEFEWGYLNAGNCCNCTNDNDNNIEIFVFGHDKQILIAAKFDNLGKGASGAAIQNMNIMLGLDETHGLI